MKRFLSPLLLVAFLSGRAVAEKPRLILDVNVFQGYRSNFSLREASPPSVVVLPPDSSWSDDIERQRDQIATTLGFDGVAVIARERADVVEGETFRFESGRDWRFPYQVQVRAERMNGDRADLEMSIIQRNERSKQIASASISGGLGKTIILAGQAPGNPLFVAVTPRVPGPAGNESRVKTVGGGVTQPRLIHRVDPGYPEKVRKEKAEGKVVIQAIIDKDGKVSRASVVRPVHAELDAAALDAVRRWRYEPARQNGEPVAVYMTVTIDFRVK